MAANLIGGLDLGAEPAVVDEAVAKLAFESLAKKFGFDEKIVGRLISLGFRSPEELAKVPTEQLSTVFIEPISLGERSEVNLARLIIAQERIAKAIKVVEVTWITDQQTNKLIIY